MSSQDSQDTLNIKVQTVEQNSKQLNDKTDKRIQSTTADLRALHDEIGRIRAVISDEERNQEAPLSEKDLQASLQSLRETLWQGRKDFSNELEKPIESIAKATREQLRLARKERNILDLEHMRDFGWHIEQLISESAVISQQRKECAKMMESALLLEFQKLRTALTRAKEDREETNDAMIKMMEEMHAQARSDLALSKKHRIAAEEAVLQVLEDACNEMEHAVYPDNGSQDNIPNSAMSFKDF